MAAIFTSGSGGNVTGSSGGGGSADTAQAYAMVFSFMGF